MHDIIVILGLLACVVALVPLANRLSVPYPILLVLGGLILGFIPNSILPDVVLRPDLVFLIFLPPLLYWTSLTTPWREFRQHMRPILLLAIGLVVATIFGIAAVAHTWVPELTWSLAFVLGAIVSPPDAVAATAIADRLGLPQRVATILEGESLVNDATALVAYGTAVEFATKGRLSIGHTALQFGWEAIGGVAIGLAVGWAIVRLRRHVNDPLIESAISLLTPFAAYLPGYLLGSSGVLAVVAAGFVVQRFAPLISGSRSRLQADSIWEVVNFLLTGLVFILIGLQLHPIFLSLAGRSLHHLIAEGVVISLAAIVVRIIWIFISGTLVRTLDPHRDDVLSVPEEVVIAWTGMRGVVSLAAALALPLTFPHRDLIVFLTFCVILITLVAQGLSLPLLIQSVGLAEVDAARNEEARARRAATAAALAYVESVEDGMPAELVEDVRRRLRARALALSREGAEVKEYRARVRAYQDLQCELLAIERRTVLELRNRGDINDETLRHIQRDLDLEEMRLQANSS